MKKNKLLIVLFCLVVLLVGVTSLVSFSSNTEVEEIIVKSITPVYDENSTIVVDNNNVVFNDKNQVVEYKVVIENTQDYNVKIDEILLSSPSQEFLNYNIANIYTDDIIKANSTKEFSVYLETTGIRGWGRNFNDQLTAEISFIKLPRIPSKHHNSDGSIDDSDSSSNEDVKPPIEDDDEEVGVPNKPFTNTDELVSKTDKVEVIRVTKDTIEFKETPKLVKGDKLAVWLYSDPIFLGYFDVVEKDGTKQIVGLEEALKQAEVKKGEHNIVLVSPKNETIGYVEVYINDDKGISQVSPEDGKIENPYTSGYGFLTLCLSISGTVIVGIFLFSRKKPIKYIVLILALSSTLTLVKAEETIELSILLNVSFKSQNVMKPSGFEWDGFNSELLSENYGVDYWAYATQIKNFYIHNEITEIDEYAFKFDVTEDNNGRVMAYLIERNDDSVCFNFDYEEDACYDLYLQADGVIYPNEDASYYFAAMENLDKIDNLAGIDTSEVIDMSGMFAGTGSYSETFILNVSSFDTSKVLNMKRMFDYTGSSNLNFTLDVSNFDTSNVTDMSRMFYCTGEMSEIFTLDVSNFDTSKVTDMYSMFNGTGYNSSEFTLDVTNFDTGNITDMSWMFNNTGYNSENFTLDVSNFDTSNVTDMSWMFSNTGFNNPNFTLDVSNFDTSNVTNMYSMFSNTGYNSETFTLAVSNFDTSNVTDMSSMFYGTGYNSIKLNTSITIKNPNVKNYSYMFQSTALKQGTQIKVNYTKETETLVDRMIATKFPNSNVVKGNLIVDVDNLSVGDEIHISGEKFNVISQTDDSVTMLAQYSLGTDYKQNTTANTVTFADDSGWEYTPGPKEIDIQTWSTNPKTYVNAYVEYLKEELTDYSLFGDLITLRELSDLGCTVESDYAWINIPSTRTCTNSTNKSWIVNGRNWWTRSALPGDSDYLWSVNGTGTFYSSIYSSNASVRPTITISKQTLRNLDKKA